MTDQNETQEVAVAEKKIDIAARVFKECASLDKPRATFMNIMVTDHKLSKNCAASYYQMLKMEAEGKGRYKHHKYVSKKAKAEKAALAAAATPEVPAGVTEIAAETSQDAAANA